MTLTAAQNSTLKAHILATPELNAFPNNEDGAENDLIRIDVDAIQSGTAPKGLLVTLGFNTP